ncbi:MAG: 3-phosphoglycerate dehydrogenase [Micrococcales bacterium]|nr:MAG: 3-phosphoglycerate dehydrogenase [Micrococcales bacterium]PIE27765.1 MAG: 3-phosphoglycerate dehydrogenase [Micrococcales bacterium]
MSQNRFRIQTLNNISSSGLSRLPSESYEVGPEVADPHALLLRSANLHGEPIPASVLAVARAGAGTNNIPVEEFTTRGIPVFNTPGANANAVKELVLASALMFARNLFHAALFARDLPGDDAQISKKVESGKKTYVGFELPGRTLGVVGLGAIGVQVANAAQALGMRVVGYDPQITVRHAWQLSAAVERADTLEDVFRQADFLTLHVPLNDGTKNLVNTQRLSLMKPDAVLLNFARGGIVDDAAVIAALDRDQLRGYVCDFPGTTLNTHPKVIALPHLGASTVEAEDNCALMAADELRAYLENGQIYNSVNLPDAKLPRNEANTRILIVNSNVVNIVGQVTTAVAEAGLNIADLLNTSKGEHAVTVLDVEGEVPDALRGQLAGIEGVLSVRVLHPTAA